jgi:anaerobic selenocysteine-containing dehydrogenase
LQTMLWARILDRRRGGDPPALLCVDPRLTPVAREADVPLAPMSGTNLALMNGLMRELIRNGGSTRTTSPRTPSATTRSSGWWPPTPEQSSGSAAFRRRTCARQRAYWVPAARYSPPSSRVFTSPRQQRHRAVNDIHLLRGMLGRPGAGLYQMNGQPTALKSRRASSPMGETRTSLSAARERLPPGRCRIG